METPLLPNALPLPALLMLANKAGATFRLAGSQLRVTAPADAALQPVLAALKARKENLWALLGGRDLDQPSLDLIGRLGVEPVVPQTIEEAYALLAEMEHDSDINTPEPAQRMRGGLLGFDTETAANPGEDTRPAVRLRLRDGRPSRNQPALKNGAALDSHRSTIRLAQLYGGGRRCLVLDMTIVPLDVLTDVLRRRVMVMHNASFELRFLAEAGMDFPRFEDTMQAAGLLLGTHRRSLDQAVNSYLGIDLPKGLQRSDFSAPRLSPGQIAYAALDAIVTFRLWLKLRLDLYAKERSRAYILQRDVTPAVVHMTRRGITLDHRALQAQMAEWNTTIATARRVFTTDAGQPPPVTPNETRDFLTKVLPSEVIEAWPRTGRQQALSIKAADLKRHISRPPIRALLAINAATKLTSTFGDDLANKVSAKSGRLHANYNVAATKAGRFSASNPNIQQIPKNKAKALRRCFVAAPGMKLVIADYNAMELRAAAAISQDAAMNADFANGVDLHRHQAAEMLGIPLDEVSKQQRDAAKPICFGTIYGAGRRGLAASAWANYDMVLSEDDAEAARQVFLARYPDLAAWMDRSYTESNRQGALVAGRLGRVIEASWEHQQCANGRYNWRFPEEDDDLDLDEEEMYQRRPLQRRSVLKRTLCCNAPVQGACADAAMLALTSIEAALTEANIEGGPVLFVHDEIVLEVPEADVERAGAMLVDAMTQAFATTFPNAPLAGLVEVWTGRAWGPSELAGPIDSADVADAQDDDGAAPAQADDARNVDVDAADGVAAPDDPRPVGASDEFATPVVARRASQTIHEGDCIACMRRMAPRSIAAVITSPPYNFGKSYGVHNDSMSETDYLAWQRQVANEIARLLTPNGHLFLNVGWSSKHPLRFVQVMHEYNRHLTLQQPFIWVKSLAIDGSTLPPHLYKAIHGRQIGHLLPSTSNYYVTQTSEIVWHFSPSGRSDIDVDAPGVGVGYVYQDQPARFGHHRELHCRGNVVHIPYKTTQSRADRDFHPAPFPVALAEYFLRLADLKPDDVVLDPFMGTGATLIAAKRLGQLAIGIDIDPAYCLAAQRRLATEGDAPDPGREAPRCDVARQSLSDHANS
jgi:DNA polymerase I-like protein with 3'-5' exonuclease and polymerase domains/DNA modification methylase